MELRAVGRQPLRGHVARQRTGAVGVPEDHVARLDAQPLDHLGHRVQARAAKGAHRDLARERAHPRRVERADRERERGPQRAQPHGAPAPVAAQRVPGTDGAPADDGLGGAAALRGGVQPRIERRDDGLVLVGRVDVVPAAAVGEREPSAARDRDALERRHGHVQVEVVAVRRVDAIGDPQPGVGELDVRGREQARQLLRGVGGALRRGPVLEPERVLVAAQPGVGERVVVVAGDHDHGAALEALADRAQHRRRAVDDLAEGGSGAARACRRAGSADRRPRAPRAAFRARPRARARRPLHASRDAGRRRPACASLVSRANRLRKHEADVLARHLELRDVGDPARAKHVDELLDERLGCARPGGDAHGAGAVEPSLVELAGVVDQMRRGAAVGGHLDEALRVGGVARADHEHDVALARELAHRGLTVGRRVTDVVGARADDLREALAQALDDAAGLVHRERGLGDEGDVLGVLEHQRVDVRLGLHEDDPIGRLAHRALDLLVAVVADEDDRVARGGEAARLDMHLRDERAGRVDRLQPQRPGVLVHDRRHAVRGEDRDRPLGDLGLAVDEDRAALAQPLDDVLVVDDLLAHVDGRPVALERALDRLDRAIDARAVAARRGEKDAFDAHRRILRRSSSRPRRGGRLAGLTGRR